MLAPACQSQQLPSLRGGARLLDSPPPLLRQLFPARSPVLAPLSSPAPPLQVEAGLEMYQSEGCDFILSFGGGSSHDNAKAIGEHTPRGQAVFPAAWSSSRLIRFPACLFAGPAP